jgi:2-C-methyl-D-erythritol 2,4-cyclodiphosphate synthase
VEAFAGHPEIDGIVVVARADEVARCRAELAGVSKVLGIAVGGRTRQDSVSAGLFLLGDGAEAPDLPDGSDVSDLSDGLAGGAGVAPVNEPIVLVHDAARPLVSHAVITRCLHSAIEHGSGIAAMPVADTLKSADADGRIIGTVPRDGLWAVQTPQAFPVRILMDAHVCARDEGFSGTDEASLVERLGAPVMLVEGAPENFKITRPEDLALAEAVLAGRARQDYCAMRIGFGYDIHRLAAGRELYLGGVRIDHSRGLDGHSDADVLLHAICDALLGAAGLPDIGVLFPNTDPAYKDARSTALLAEVVRRIGEAGYAVGNIDATVIAEAPKIGPHVADMRRIIAEILEVEGACIGIKATTNEGLGAIGRQEGIAAHAVACLRGASH